MGDGEWGEDELLEEHEIVGISSVTPKQQRFIHLYMTGQYTLQKLSQLLEVHPNTLSNWLKRKDVSDIIADMQSTTHKTIGIQIKAMGSKAVGRLQELMDSPIDGVALQAVKDALDRGGHKPKQEITVDKRVVTFEEKLTNLIESTVDDDIIEIEGDEVEE